MPEYDLKRFMTRSFQSSSAHVPPGGLGCFFASYVPSSGLMKVQVKIAPRLVNPSGADVDPEKKKQLMDAFKAKVPEAWNNRFRFTLTKQGFNRLSVQPQFEIVEESPANAHYYLKIVNLEKGAICVRTGEDPGLQALKDRKLDPYRGKLSTQMQLNAWNAANMTQAENILSAIAKPVKVAHNDPTPPPGIGLPKLDKDASTHKVGTSFSMVTMERLRTFARDVNVTYEHSKRTPKVTIAGPGASGAEIAKTVSRMLDTFGLKAKYTLQKGGEAGFIVLSLDETQINNLKTMITGNVKQFPQFAQQAIVHEFGHMLGLPDEYMCISAGAVGLVGTRGLAVDNDQEKAALNANTTTDQQSMTPGIQQSQVEFIRLCSQFGVPVPPFGRSNPNIMSSGMEFQPCHGVTVAHSLWSMTKNYCKPSDWRIDAVR